MAVAIPTTSFLLPAGLLLPALTPTGICQNGDNAKQDLDEALGLGDPSPTKRLQPVPQHSNETLASTPARRSATNLPCRTPRATSISTLWPLRTRQPPHSRRRPLTHRSPLFLVCWPEKPCKPCCRLMSQGTVLAAAGVAVCCCYGYYSGSCQSSIVATVKSYY